MQIVIEIDEEIFNKLPNAELSSNIVMDVLDAVEEGTPILTGHWIDKDDKSAVCPCCNRNNTLYGNFCKWCGAKMEEV